MNRFHFNKRRINSQNRALGLDWKLSTQMKKKKKKEKLSPIHSVYSLLCLCVCTDLLTGSDFMIKRWNHQPQNIFSLGYITTCKTREIQAVRQIDSHLFVVLNENFCRSCCYCRRSRMRLMLSARNHKTEYSECYLKKCDTRRNVVEKDINTQLMTENLNCFHSPQIELYQKDPTIVVCLFFFF